MYDIKVRNANRSKFDFSDTNHIYIGRACERFTHAPFGNVQFPLRNERDRESVLRSYDSWLTSTIEGAMLARSLALRLRSCDNKRKIFLYCWCAPKPCHGECLAREALVWTHVLCVVATRYGWTTSRRLEMKNRLDDLVQKTEIPYSCILYEDATNTNEIVEHWARSRGLKMRRFVCADRRRSDMMKCCDEMACFRYDESESYDCVRSRDEALKCGVTVHDFSFVRDESEPMRYVLHEKEKRKKESESFLKALW